MKRPDRPLRQRDGYCLEQIARGMTDETIGRRLKLHFSVNSEASDIGVGKNGVKHLFKEFHVTSKPELVSAAFRWGYLQWSIVLGRPLDHRNLIAVHRGFPNEGDATFRMRRS